MFALICSLVLLMLLYLLKIRANLQIFGKSGLTDFHENLVLYDWAHTPIFGVTIFLQTMNRANFKTSIVLICHASCFSNEAHE